MQAPAGLSAQQPHAVTGVKGVAFISGDVSPNQAKTMALNDAKLNALKTAGIGEYLNSYQVLFTSQKNNDYSRFFSSDIQAEMQGAVQQYHVTGERIFCKGEFDIVYEVNINAEVIKYSTRPDPALDANIEGLKAVYKNDDKLTFSVKTTQDCFLTIFNITDTEALVLYPNEYETQSKCFPLQTCKFPTAKIDYFLHTDLANGETNRLIFVFTKSLVPFIKVNKEQVTSHENIFSWIYSIMPDQRKIQYFSFLIQK
jgi:hypothetical protein